MTRSRMRFEYITKDAARKATFKKRKDGLTKKLSELTTLCGIEACAVILSAYNHEPDVWPNPMGVQHVISQYRVMSEVQKKNILDQKSFIQKRIAKARQQLERIRKERRDKERELIMQECMAGMGVRNLSMADMNDTARQIEKKLEDIDKKMKKAMEKEQVYRPELAAPPAEASDHHHVQQVNNDQLWRDKYLTFAEDGLHLAFGDISREENDFWFKLFP